MLFLWNVFPFQSIIGEHCVVCSNKDQFNTNIDQYGTFFILMHGLMHFLKQPTEIATDYPPLVDLLII